MIEFRKKVHDSDPHLFDKFMKNIDHFQRKGVSLYHEALRKHGSNDIWAKGVLGKQLTDWRNAVKLSSDQLFSFISSGRFVFAVDKYMPLDDFKQEYFEFRRAGGVDKIKWNKEHYDSCFQEKGMEVLTGTHEYPAGSGNPKVTKKFIHGIDLRGEDEAVAT